MENNKIITSIIILITSILMVSKVPTYSLKRISIPRRLGGFLILSIGIYISVIFNFTFEVLFLTPERRETGTYIFTNESNELIGAMYCTTFISPTKATCMKSLFSSVQEGVEDIELK